MELPTAPFYRRWSFLLAGVIGVAAIVALLGWRGLQEVATPSTTATTVPVTTQVPPTTTEPEREFGSTSKPSLLLWEEEESTRSKVRSPLFRAPSVWRIEWAFDCSNFAADNGGNFKITGNGAFEQIDIQNVAIRANGTRTVRRGGNGHLFVETVCERWTVRVLSG
jgi:hypothetical protein